jgi:formylglycine-generating enzyme required for sulfatase activity
MTPYQRWLIILLVFVMSIVVACGGNNLASPPTFTFEQALIATQTVMAYQEQLSVAIQGTESAYSRLTEQAIADSTATQMALVTPNRREIILTQRAEFLATEQIIRDATATQLANIRATQQITTIDATATQSANLRATQQVNIDATATQLVNIRATEQVNMNAIATQSANLRASLPRNEDWTPQEQEFDGVTMVLVPAGCFMMGSDGVDTNLIHEQCFDTAFWIDKYEVTQAQFAQFNGQKANTNYFTGDDLPVEHITWREATDYCDLRGGRLPTEREWEYAARGPSNLIYPWGNEFEASYVVSDSDQTSPVGSHPDGASWVGALDMSGNVWEWTSSFYDEYPYDMTDEVMSDDKVGRPRSFRGGAWGQGESGVLSTFRGLLINPDFIPIGIRCARSE